MGRYKKGEWSAKYQRVLILYEKGHTQDEIATQTGYERSHIGKLLRSDKFQTRITRYEGEVQEDVLDLFKKNALEAARKILRISKTGVSKDRLQYEAAKEILYQVGCKPKEIVETITREYTPQEISAALNTVHEIEDITDRLTKKKSRFLVADAKKPSEAPKVEQALKTSPDRPKTSSK